MNLLQNENAKTNGRQKLCQENERVFGVVEKIYLHRNNTARISFAGCLTLRSIYYFPSLDQVESSMLVSARFKTDRPVNS
jgi:hypothetical protein